MIRWFTEVVGWTASRMGMYFELIREEKTFEPALNLARDAAYLEETDAGGARVWMNDRCVVLGRFLDPGEEVHLSTAEEMGIPVLKRMSGGGAVYQDLGNINYSLYLDAKSLHVRSISEGLRALSYPVAAVLESLGIPWEWVPPNNVYVAGRKISGSAQAHRRGRVLHHGTLLVACDLETMHALLKPGGRSRMAPVINLGEVVPGIAVEDVEKMLAQAIVDHPEL